MRYIQLVTIVTSDKCQTVSSKVRVRRDYYAIVVKQTVQFEETNCCFSPIGCEFWILFNRCIIHIVVHITVFCCTQPLRSTARYALGEVIEINDFLLGTMAGGAADCSLIGSQSWWFRLGGTRGCWLPWDWPPRYFETYPYLTLHTWKGC